jgi:DNA mismatch repair protein MutS2
MDNHTLNLLEFGRIATSVQDYCVSEEGRELLGSTVPYTDAQTVRRVLALVSDYRRIFDGDAEVPHLTFPAVRFLLRHLEKPGTVLEPEELAAIGTFAQSAGRMRAFLLEHAGPSLHPEAEAVPELDGVVRAVFAVVDPQGAVKERQIPELRNLASRIKTLRGDVDRLIAGYLSDADKRTYWQSDLPTERDGRTVLPLKASHKGRVPGVVHEVSSTGSTVFIEPLDVVEKNNAIVEAQNEYRRELLRILRELTATVASELETLARQIDQIAYLDGIYARARYGRHHACFAAKPVAKGLDLRQARHPLLGRSAVPIDVHLDEETRVMVVTGPNTGGKTVAMKTVGVLALMNQLGMEIPAEEGSALPIFTDVLADIGDEQSLQQSLSTFSGHMQNIARIDRVATETSLVLLDELGAGTDPEEGAAIAMALLDRFIHRGSTVMITTHHGILKNYGYSTPGVANASVDFDTRTLTPTYRIVLGVPGESHAIEIAARNGISPEAVQQARLYLNEERTDVARLINDLSEKQRELHRRVERQEVEEHKLQSQRRAAEAQERKLQERERTLREHGITELNAFLSESRKTLENLVRRLREQGEELSREDTLAVKRFLEGVADRVDAETKVVEESEPAPAAPDVELEPGMDVEVGSLRKRGTILRQAKGGKWVVSTGNLRMTLPTSELRPARPEADAPGPAVDTGAQRVQVPYEIDVRGQRLEAALKAVESQLDRALVAGAREFGIIHGKGQGILQRGIHDYLQERPEVEDYSFSHPERGGFGRTVVRLRG